MTIAINRSTNQRSWSFAKLFAVCSLSVSVLPWLVVAIQMAIDVKASWQNAQEQELISQCTATEKYLLRDIPYGNPKNIDWVARMPEQCQFLYKPVMSGAAVQTY